MAQLGKYSSDRDCILHYMATSEWANDSFGDCSTWGSYVWKMSNDPADVHMPNTEITSLIEDEIRLYDIEDSPDFRRELEGNFLIVETDSGAVYVTKFETALELAVEFAVLRQAYDAFEDQPDS